MGREDLISNQHPGLTTFEPSDSNFCIENVFAFKKAVGLKPMYSISCDRCSSFVLLVVS